MVHSYKYAKQQTVTKHLVKRAAVIYETEKLQSSKQPIFAHTRSYLEQQLNYGNCIKTMLCCLGYNTIQMEAASSPNAS